MLIFGIVLGAIGTTLLLSLTHASDAADQNERVLASEAKASQRWHDGWNACESVQGKVRK